MEELNLLHDFFDSESDANINLEACEQENLEERFQDWYNQKSKDLEFVSRPLIKHLAENYHPHMSCKVDSTSVELLEGQKAIYINNYIVD